MSDLEPLKEAVVDPGGGREKGIGFMTNTINSPSPKPPLPKPHPPKPCPPAAPSLLGAIVHSVPQILQGTIAPQAPGEEGTRYGQMLAPPFHERFPALGAGAPVAVRRSARVLSPSVRLRPLPDQVRRPVPIARTAQTTPGTARSWSVGATARRATTGGGHGKRGTAAQRTGV